MTPRDSDLDVGQEERTAALSPTRAFVVQFLTKTDSLTGRAEHLASGEAVFFANQRELFRFFDRTLRVTDRIRKK